MWFHFHFSVLYTELEFSRSFYSYYPYICIYNYIYIFVFTNIYFCLPRFITTNTDFSYTHKKSKNNVKKTHKLERSITRIIVLCLNKILSVTLVMKSILLMSCHYIKNSTFLERLSNLNLCRKYIHTGLITYP